MAEPTLAKQARHDSVENQEEYLVRNRIGIIQKLRLLAKNNCMLTATLNGGSQTLNTAVLDVIRDKDLIALECSPNENLNQQILVADRLSLNTEFDGIEVQFTVTSLTKAEYQGEAAFAAPIPDSMLWIQRRQAYRARVPLGIPAHIELATDHGHDQFTVLDISADGLAIQDDHYHLNLDPGAIIDNCKLLLPGHGSADITLEVRNRFPVNRANLEAGQRLGSAFVNLNMGFGSNIHRYIHTLELMRRHAAE